MSFETALLEISNKPGVFPSGESFNCWENLIYNGKCANRLLASSGLPLIATQMKKLELSSMWALLATFQDPLPVNSDKSGIPFEGAFVKGFDSLSWMANITTKLFGQQTGGAHCSTFFSTAAFGKQNKVPRAVQAFAAEHLKTPLGNL